MMNKLDELEKTADFFSEDSIYGFDTSEVNEFAKETKKLIAVARAVQEILDSRGVNTDLVSGRINLTKLREAVEAIGDD